MRRRISKAEVWHHIMCGLIALGSCVGPAEAYGEYVREGACERTIDTDRHQPEPEWDWSIPNRWYDEAWRRGSV